MGLPPLENQPCRPTRKPMYETFEKKKVDDEDLWKKRAALAANFFLFSYLDLDRVREEIHKAVRRGIEGGVFGAFVESMLMSSFWWKNELSSVIPEKMAETDAVLNNWHRFLDQAVTYTPDSRYVFCGFSTIEDITINLSQDVLNALAEAIPVWEDKPAAEVWFEAKQRAARNENQRGGKLDDAVYDGIDVLATLINLMQRAGLKPTIADPLLEDFVRSFMESKTPRGVMPGSDRPGARNELNDIFDKHYQKRRGTNEPRTSFGGAAGNQAELLRLMGFEVLISMPYHHHPNQSSVAPDCAKRIVFGQDPPILPVKTGCDGDPRRLSFVFNLVPTEGEWPALRMCGDEIKVSRKQADRVIFRRPAPFTDPVRDWAKLRIRYRSAQVEIDRYTHGRNLRPGDWPLFFLFQRSIAVEDNGTLVIDLATPEDVALVASQIRCALLGGVDQMASTVYTPECTQLLRVALIDQLKALSSAGVNLRYEIPRPLSGAVLDNLKKIFKDGGLKSVSVNREELSQMTSEYGSSYYTWVPPAPLERQLGIYERAIHLATQLGVSSVFVHDPGLDIFVVQNSTDRPSKGQVDVDERELVGHRQAMLCAKAAVPEMFYRRANEESTWSLVLAKQSFYELLLFARNYSEKMAAREPEARRKERRAEIEKSIRENGYWRTEKKDDFSVVVSPGIVLELPPTVGMAGAGDQNTAAEQATFPLFL